MRSDAPRALPTPEVAAAALGLQSVDARGMCEGENAVREATSESDDEPIRLGDRVPKRSPIPGFRLDRIVSADAARDRDVPDAAIDGYLAWFAREGDDPAGDGYELDVFRHLSPTAAATSLTEDVTRRACGAGVTAFEASGRDGLLILQDTDLSTTTALWTSGTDLVRVTYGGWTDPAEALSRVAAVAGAAALY